MAVRLAQHEEVKVYAKGEKPGNTKIPWAKYADGGQWRLVRGEDWTCKSPNQVVEMAERYARSHGYAVRTLKDGYDAVIVEFRPDDMP